MNLFFQCVKQQLSLYFVASDLTSSSIFLIAQPCFLLVNSPLPPQVAAPSLQGPEL